jgi:hypothetical protein
MTYQTGSHADSTLAPKIRIAVARYGVMRSLSHASESGYR